MRPGAAWVCKEKFTPDGKSCVWRERHLGDSAVRAVVALASLVVVLILALTGHTLIAGPVSVGGLIQSLGSEVIDTLEFQFSGLTRFRLRRSRNLTRKTGGRPDACRSRTGHQDGDRLYRRYLDIASGPRPVKPGSGGLFSHISSKNLKPHLRFIVHTILQIQRCNSQVRLSADKPISSLISSIELHYQSLRGWFR
jgi:hypothetical protein